MDEDLPTKQNRQMGKKKKGRLKSFGGCCFKALTQ